MYVVVEWPDGETRAAGEWWTGEAINNLIQQSKILSKKTWQTCQIGILDWLYLALSSLAASLTLNHHKSPIPEFNIIASAPKVVRTARQSDRRRWSVICYRRLIILICRWFSGVGHVRFLRRGCGLTNYGSMGTVRKWTRCNRVHGWTRGRTGFNLVNIRIILVSQSVNICSMHCILLKVV